MITILSVVYIFFPILCTPLVILGLYWDKRKYKYYIFILILNLAIIGYHFKPLVADDLYRHFKIMDELKKMGLINIFKGDPLIIKNIWFYFLALLNKGLLPFSAIMITYYTILKDIFYFSKKEGFSHVVTTNISLIILIFVQLIWVMSGIRFAVSISLFIHGLYKEFVLKEKGFGTYVFYIVPCFIHYSTFILIFIRFLIIFKNKSKTIIIISLLSWGYFAKFLVNILEEIKIEYVQEVAFKANIYLNYTNNTSYMLVTNLLKLFYCIIFIIFFIYLRKKNNSLYKKYQDIYDYGLLMSLFCMGGFNIFIILDRIGFVVLILLPLVLIPVFKYNKAKLLKQIAKLSFMPIILIGLYLQYVPLKATNYNITFIELITKDIVRLFIK